LKIAIKLNEIKISIKLLVFQYHQKMGTRRTRAYHNN